MPPQQSARSIVRLPAGASLQAALDEAQPGDVLLLEAGARFEGPFVLPAKLATGWIVVRSEQEEEALPLAGQRVQPTHAAAMPKLTAGSGSVIIAAPGAHHYRFIGIEIHPRPGRFIYNLVELGDTGMNNQEVPHHILFERCYIHGDRKLGGRRGIAMNSAYTAIVDSYLADFKESGAESQAIAAWSGPGPFLIRNNHLEAAGENILFGGADPPSRSRIPSDIVVQGNYLTKPLTWRAEATWAVKNLFELKNARRVLVEANLFENNWVAAQNGFAILLTVRNQEGSAPWSVVEDVTFVSNVVRNVAAGINILGRDNSGPNRGGQTRRVRIAHNLFVGIGGPAWGGGGVLFQILNGTVGVVIEHNTALQSHSLIVAEGLPHRAFTFRYNVAPHRGYGIVGTGTQSGTPTVATYFPHSIVAANVIVGGNKDSYPPDNHFPVSFAEAGIVMGQNGWPQLRQNSPYRRIANDRPAGADLIRLQSALAAADP